MAKSKKNTIGLNNLKGFQLGASFEPKDLIPTGHSDLDYNLSRGFLDAEDSKYKNGGFPLGKLVLLYGNEGGGKSSIAYRTVGSAQRMGYRCAWIDSEHSFSDQLAAVNGVDKDILFYSNLIDTDDPNQTNSAEEIMDLIVEVCNSGKIDVLVLDSVANLVPQKVLDRGADKETVAELSRVLSRSLPKIMSYAAKNNVLLMFITQLREKIGIMFGNTDTYGGGRSLKHNASVVLKISKLESKSHNIFIQDDDGKESIIGRHSSVIIEKNRFAKPCFESLRIPIYFESYFPDAAEIAFEYGRKCKLINKRLNVFSWNSNKVEGKSEFIDFLNNDPDVLGDLIKQIEESISGSDVILPVELINFNPEENEKIKQPEEYDHSEEDDQLEVDDVSVDVEL
jgi:recombination protein RecA